MTFVADLFDVVADRMRSDLRITRLALTHPGLRGAGFEESFRTFLRAYLPRSLDVVTGILIDSAGRSSRQLDVIVVDAAKTPIFYSVGDVRVVPIECAYMAFEVKALLNSTTLEQCFRNMDSVRTLEKLAYVPMAGPIINNIVAYGRKWPIYPINYFVFAFDSTDPAALTTALHSRYTQGDPPVEKRIDAICILDKGVICNQLPNGSYDALPEPGSHVFLCQTPKALLLFYTLVSRYANQAWLPPFRFRDYLGEITFGSSPPVP